MREPKCRAAKHDPRDANSVLSFSSAECKARVIDSVTETLKEYVRPTSVHLCLTRAHVHEYWPVAFRIVTGLSAKCNQAVRAVNAELQKLPELVKAEFIKAKKLMREMPQVAAKRQDLVSTIEALHTGLERLREHDVPMVSAYPLRPNVPERIERPAEPVYSPSGDIAQRTSTAIVTRSGSAATPGPAGLRTPNSTRATDSS